MASPFDDIDGATQDVMRSVFGEAIRVFPRKHTNYSSGPDPDREERDTTASVLRAPRATSVDFANTNRAGVALSAAPSELWIDRASYAALGYEIARGDEIELVDRGGLRVTVSDVQRGDHRDVCVQFVAGGTPE